MGAQVPSGVPGRGCRGNRKGPISRGEGQHPLWERNLSIGALHNTVSDQAAISESQDILQLTKATFVTSEVDGELIILITVAKPVVGQVV